MVALLLLLSTGVAQAQAAPKYLGPKPPAQVRRVVTLAPSLTEVVVALGAKDRLVGVSRFDELPEVKSLPRVGGFLDPSIEAVLALKPDLVIVQPSPGSQRALEKIAQLGAPVLEVPLVSLEETLGSMREIGRVLGLEPRAEELVQHIQDTRARIRALAKGQASPRVLLVYEWSPLIVAGTGSFADQLLKDAGGTNVAPGGSAYPMLPVEAALAARPEVIIDSAHDAVPERLRTLRGFAEARWVKLSTGDLMHPGPSLTRALEDLYRLLHPGRSTASR